MKSFFKFLSRNKLYTFIEVVGLAIALSFVVFISSFVINELSYDKNLKNTEDIYIGRDQSFITLSATVKDQLGAALPEIMGSCRMLCISSMAGVELSVKVGDNIVKQKALAVDTDFFNFFTFPFVAGDREHALEGKNAVVVSESFAHKYFGDKNPLGQTLRIIIDKDQVDLVVTGVFEDFRKTVFPETDFIYRIEQQAEHYPNIVQNGNGTTVTFFRLSPQADKKSLEIKAKDILKANDYLYMSGLIKEFYFTPFSDIHFGVKGNTNPFVGVIDMGFVSLFIAAAVLLLIFALLNYISLTVAQIGFRAKEMTTRRLLGEQRGGIVLRYLTEAFLLTLSALVLAIILISVFQSHFSTLIGKDVYPFEEVGGVDIAVLIALLLLLSLLAGVIPALMVSKYKPIDVIKGDFAVKSRISLGKVFIGVQNGVSIATLCLALAMLLQIRFMSDKELGYESDNIVSVYGAKQYADYDAETLRTLPFVERIGHVQFLPSSSGRSSWRMTYKGESVNFEMLVGDKEAFELQGFEVVRQNAEPVNRSLWLTESTMRNLGLDYDCTLLDLDGNSVPVCGIIKDIQRGARSEEDCKSANICYFMKNMDEKDDFEMLPVLVVKVSGDEKEAVKALKAFYGEKQLDKEIWITTVNEDIEALYGKEKNNLKLIVVFALLTLMLSVMAMVAMSTYYTQQQAKNVSIRKVFGFDRKDVFFTMLNNFLKIVLFAALIALPAGFVIVRRWLQDYSYRIDNHWWIYAVVLLVVLTVSALAISMQAVQLMNTNPVKTLKKE